LAWTPPASAPDRVLISASQLAAGDFPAVCVMTGAPAETWGKFRFSTAPAWAVVFVFLICVGGIGFFVTLPLTYLVSRHASGKLPLTHASMRKVGLPMRIGIPALVVGLVLLLIALTTVTRNPLVGVLLIFSLNIGVLVLVAGAVLVQVGLQLGRTLIGPRAKVLKHQPGQADTFVELQRVHPLFVTAVLEMQRARGTAPLSQPPGSI
jgi:hypothetical protein